MMPSRTFLSPGGAAALAATLSLTPLAASAQALPGIDQLPETRAGTLRMKLEKTIFKVDVLNLTLRVDPTTADSLADELDAAAPDEPDEAGKSRMARAIVHTPRAAAEIEFLRNVSLDQFLDGIDDDMERAVEMGWLEQTDYERIRDGLRVWFSFLDQRGIHKGDRLHYAVEGDTLRTVYVAVSRGEREADGGAEAGSVLLDQTDVGWPNRTALLGAYMAEGSSFRKKLLDSLP